MKQIGYSEKPVVIVGCQRSGTTLLRTILGRHPQLLEHPDEPQFILELYQRFGYKVRDVDTAVAYLLKHPYLPDSITAEALRAAFAPDRQLTLHDFFQKFLHVWAGERLLTQRPILKHPALIYHLDLVATLFPETTLVHIVRDPRGSVSSQKARWAQYTTYQTATLWKEAIQNIRAWGQQKTLPVVEISYEQMLLRPEEELNQLCQHLSLPFSPTLLTSDNTGEDMTIYTPKSVTYRSVDATRLRKWQERLSPLEIWLIETICHEEMKAYGYELSQPSAPKRGFYGRLWYERLHYHYKRYGRALKQFFRQLGWRFGFGLLKVPPP